MNAAMKIFEQTKTFPPEEKYSMVDQMRRSSRSLCALLRFSFGLSVPGLALLKIISWNDNKLRSGKIAHDLLLLMRTYLDAGNQERLWNEEADLVGEDFDYVPAGSRLLGRDIAKLLSPDSKEAVAKILDKETGEQSQYRLVENMMDKHSEGRDFEEALQLL
jgi:predicted nucleotidyltransferase